MEDRATRRNRAKKLRLIWRELPREFISKTNGKTKIKSTQIYVPVPA